MDILTCFFAFQPSGEQFILAFVQVCRAGTWVRICQLTPHLKIASTFSEVASRILSVDTHSELEPTPTPVSVVPKFSLVECQDRKFNYDALNDRGINDRSDGSFDFEECCEKFFGYFDYACEYIDMCEVLFHDSTPAPTAAPEPWI